MRCRMKRALCVVLLLTIALFCVGCADSAEDATHTVTAKIRLLLPSEDVDELIGIYLLSDIDMIVKSDAVLLNVIEGERLSCSTEELSALIRVQRESETSDVYLVSVDMSSATDAARIANAVATEFCKRVNKVYDPDGMKESVATVVEEATVSDTKDET